MKPAAAKPTLVPKLRFPEFRAGKGWITRPLGEIAKPITEKVGKKRCIPMSITSGVGLVSQMEKFGRVIAGNSYKNYLLLKNNDFAYNKSATKDYPEGFIALYGGDDLAAVPNSIFTCFRIEGNSSDPKYLNYLFLNNLHGRWLRKFIEVGARAHGSLSINDDDLFALPVPMPEGKSSDAEQRKIVDCLSSLDNLIRAESRKLDALKAHRKGLMQHLFPREGESVPRLRFPEFQDAGEWGTMPLGELLSCTPEYGVNAPAVPYSDSLPTYLRITDIDDDGRFLRKSKVSVAVTVSDGNYLDEGDIVLARTGASVGKSYRYRPADGRLVFAGFLIRIRPNMAKIDPVFLSNFLTTNQYWDWVRITSARSGQPGLNSEEYSSLLVPLPPEGGQCILEQHRIASCLSSLDDLIAAQAAKIEVLKTHKNGLMKQLFPTTEKVEA